MKFQSGRMNVEYAEDDQRPHLLERKENKTHCKATEAAAGAAVVAAAGILREWHQYCRGLKTH